MNMSTNMGRVTTRIRVENWLDAELVAAGARKESPRVVETEALVDTGAVKFYLKSSVIRQLGLHAIGEIKSRTMSARAETRKVLAPVSLEIQGRTGRYDVVELPDSLPNVIGQIPLEGLDFVVDPQGQQLIGNPAHGGHHMVDAF